MRVLAFVCSAVLLGTALTGTAHAQCASSLEAISQPAAFPNRAASGIVWNGSETGIVKVDHQDRSVWFSRHDRNGKQVGPDVQIATASALAPVSIFWTGDEFAVFYETPNRVLMLRRVWGDGVALAPAVEVMPVGLLKPREYSVIWDSTSGAYAIAYSVPQDNERGLWIALVEPDGRMRRTLQLTPFTALDVVPRLVRTSAGIFVTYNHSTTGQTHGFLYRDNGSVAVVNGFAPASLQPLLVWNGSYVAWIVSRAVPPGSELHWVKFDATGKVTANEALLFKPVGVTAEPAAALWNARSNEWAVTYYDSFDTDSRGDLRLARVTSTGTMISRTFFSPDRFRTNLSSASSLAWDGLAYLGAIGTLVSQGSGTQSYLVRHCPLRAEISGSRYPTLLQPTTFTAMTWGGTPPYTYEWLGGEYDASPGPLATATYTYKSFGKFTVTLTVRDTFGAQTVVTTQVEVTTPKPRPTRR